MLQRGMRNLGNTPHRPEMEGAVEHAAQAPVDESGLSGEEHLFADEVRARARHAPTQNAYVRLGLAPGATTEQIKAAYLSLVKRFHPDRASAPGLSGVLPQMQSLFALYKEAYDNIATPTQRAKYDQGFKGGGGAPGKPAMASRKEEASMMVKMGDVLLKKRDFEAALQKLRRAVWSAIPRPRRRRRRRRPR